jgi:cysteine synthase A
MRLSVGQVMGLLPFVSIPHLTFIGTGGTIAGVGRYLKSKNEDVIIALADPEGSGLYNKVRHRLLASMHCLSELKSNTQIKHGVMFDRKESEGTKRRHQVDTIVEGM